jgi:hypothetical protein
MAADDTPSARRVNAAVAERDGTIVSAARYFLRSIDASPSLRNVLVGWSARAIRIVRSAEVRSPVRSAACARR